MGLGGKLDDIFDDVKAIPGMAKSVAEMSVHTVMIPGIKDKVEGIPHIASNVEKIATDDILNVLGDLGKFASKVEGISENALNTGEFVGGKISSALNGSLNDVVKFAGNSCETVSGFVKNNALKVGQNSNVEEKLDRLNTLLKTTSGDLKNKLPVPVDSLLSLFENTIAAIKSGETALMSNLEHLFDAIDLDKLEEVLQKIEGFLEKVESLAASYIHENKQQRVMTDAPKADVIAIAGVEVVGAGILFVIESINAVFEWFTAAFPISLGVSIDAGGSAAVQASAGLSFEIMNIMEVLGGIPKMIFKMLITLVSNGLDIIRSVNTIVLASV